ncbi:response regulator [Rubrivivax gelatinosus]|uniref:response regulator n=1 Tax=Rubrivivax gelatinosus TaxID=28068 RepID=UPI0031F8B931
MPPEIVVADSGSDGPPGPRPDGTALRVALAYAALASLWILLSDRWVEGMLQDPAMRVLASIAKGWGFVAVTTLLLYLLVRRLAPGGRLLPGTAADRTRVALVAATIAALTAAGVALALHQQRLAAELTLRSIADLRATQAAAWAAARLADGARVHEMDGTRLRQRLAALRAERGYESASLLDAQQRVVWSTGPVPDPPQDPLRNAAGGSRLLGPQLDANGVAHLDLLVPLAPGQAPAGGYALLRLAGTDLPPLNLGVTGAFDAGLATVLLRREGGDPLYFGTAAGSGFAVWRRPADAGAIVAASARDAGPIEGSDERGRPALGVVQPVAGTPWWLLTRIDHGALEHQRWQAASGVLLAGVLAGLGAAGLMALRRQRQAIDRHETERRRQTARLEAVALFEAIADSSPDIIVAKDLQGRYLLFNHSAEQLAGKSRDEVLGRDDTALFPPEVAERLRTDDRNALSGCIEVEARLPTATGTREMTVTKGPLRDRSGEIIGVFGMSRDISELKKERARLAETSRIARIGGWSYDAEGRRIGWTDELRHLAEIDGDIEPDLEHALAFFGPEAQRLLEASLAETREHGTPFDLELPLQTARGRQRWVRLVGQTEFDGTLVRRAHGFVQDVTEAKTLRLELERHRADLERQVRERTADLELARARAEAGVRTKDAFIRIISHELRTPLHQILHLAPRLRRAVDAPDETFLDAADRLAEILEDVLTLSELEAGGIVPRADDFELGALLHQVREQVEADATKKHLVLTVDAGTVPLWLRGDAAMLGRALGNYARNAVKFTAAGSVHIAARRIAEHADGLTLVLEVRDTGPGIDPALKPRLFGAFEPGDVSMTRRHGGAGLGLALTRRLAELMQGQVGVDSRPGQGSRFWLRLRLARGRDAAARPQGPLPAEAVLRARHGGERVLVVDDEPVNRECTQAMLAAVGLRTLLAENGREGVERALAEPPSLVLLDLQMPELDGLGAARELRRQGATMPILAMTASIGEDTLRECLAAGMEQCVQKPIEPRELYATLLRWLKPPAAAAAALLPGAAPEPADTTAMPELPGVDGPDALERSGGSAARALSLLRLFVRSHQDDPPRLESLCAEGRWAELRQCAHALRGAAGNVGAREVHLAAAQLERQIAEQAPVAARQDAAGLLVAALGVLVDGVLALPAEAQASLAPGRPVGDTAAAVAGLALLLASGDTASSAFIAEHGPELRHSLGAEFEPLVELVESFRFDEAASLLARHAT